MKLPKWLNDILTEDDNSTVCMARVTVLIAFFTFIGNAEYSIYVTHVFNHVDFASSIMQILTGAGALIGAKQFSSKNKDK